MLGVEADRKDDGSELKVVMSREAGSLVAVSLAGRIYKDLPTLIRVAPRVPAMPGASAGSKALGLDVTPRRVFSPRRRLWRFGFSQLRVEGGEVGLSTSRLEFVQVGEPKVEDATTSVEVTVSYDAAYPGMHELVVLAEDADGEQTATMIFLYGNRSGGANCRLVHTSAQDCARAGSDWTVRDDLCDSTAFAPLR